MADLLTLPTWADGEHVMPSWRRRAEARASSTSRRSSVFFMLAKPLMADLSYPYDWGFIPSTKAPDGDPLDVLIVHDAKTYPGVVLSCRPLGVLEVEQKSGGKTERNDRVFASRIVTPGDRPQGRPRSAIACARRA